jgi:error-prone DNA polymerase
MSGGAAKGAIGRSPERRYLKSAYAELAAMSNFSFLRGASHPEEMAQTAKALKLEAIAIADRNTFAGAVRGHIAAKEAAVRFIPAVRLVLVDGAEIIALPETRDAYGRLCRLLTLGNRRARKGECHLWLEDLIAYGEGQTFIAMPPPEHFQEMRTGNIEPPDTAFIAALKSLYARFPTRVYLGAALAFDGLDARRLLWLSGLAATSGAPLVAVGDCLYHEARRKPLQDVLTCVREKCTIHEAGFHLQRNAARHLKSPDEISRLYRGYEAAVERSLSIASRCRFSLDELRYEYPDEPCEPYASPQEALAALTWNGAADRYPGGVTEKVRAQIVHELALIDKLGYARYFLTVHDLVRYARLRDILCQGRGSAANSAVCYCLGVTSVNPAEIDLLFERFISEERNEPPDIDVDFEHERREEVIQYIYEKYGRDRAGIVATVITYRAKSSMRDVGKALGLSEDIIGALSGMVWWWSSDGVMEKDIREAGLDPEDRTLRLAVKLARELTGFPRHLSQHTGGFVITRKCLEDTVPIGNAAMADRTMIEWDKDDLDALGLLKIDVLALGMLTCIRKCLALMEAEYGVRQSLAGIPQGDAAVYDMICKADTLGVFQIESRAQMSMLPRLRPRTFYDLVIEVAIVRPGPIQGDMVHPYLRRRQGLEKVEYQKDALREVLEKTLGVPLFQEQAMKIAIVAGGFTPGEADKLRRAMATFRRSGTIKMFGDKLIAGMVERGYSADFAERCFRQIEGFGEYGFPESHAASFALLVYVSCWIKFYYPDVFAAALINSQPMGFYAPAQIVRDFREHGGVAREVDVNHSNWDCSLEPLAKGEAKSARPQRALRLGFRQVKGLSPRHAEAIKRMRGAGFTSIETFARDTALPVAALRTLAEADAFRSIGLDRRQALWIVSRYAEAGAPAGAEEDLPLFAAARTSPLGEESAVTLPALSLGEHVLTDYALTRLSLKSHPMALLRPSFTHGGYIRAQDLTGVKPGCVVNIAGIVLIRQRPGSANGVIFSTLEDETGIANIIVWPKIFERFRRIVLGARLLGVRGVVQSEQTVIHVIARQLYDLSSAMDTLSERHGGEAGFLSRGDEVKNPVNEDSRAKTNRRSSTEAPADILPKGRNFH